MLFGMSLYKMLVVVSLAFLLFGVPLMGFLVTLRNRKTQDRKGGRRWDR